MDPVAVIEGSGNGSRQRLVEGAGLAVRLAQEAGYRIGCLVHLGRVPGRVVGYNIARRGTYYGMLFPLLVETTFGTVKCSLAEVTRD